MKHTDRSVCDPNCHANPKCGLAVTIDEGKVIAVEPADYPVDGYKNRICLMGRSRLEYQNHPERLTKPLKRIGERGEGQWEEVSWEEAIELFVENQRRITEEYGSRAVAITQGSGAFGLLTRGAPLRYAALTDATSVRPSGVDFGVARGLEYMFGISAMSFFGPGGHALADAVNSELTILWGVNPAVTRSVDHPALKQARKSGTKLICIDPVRSETAKLCDEWISPRPGSDGALALSMAHEVITNAWYDTDFVTEHTNLPFLVDSDTQQLLQSGALGYGDSGEYVVWCSESEKCVPLSKAQSITLDWKGVLTASDGRTINATTAFVLFSNIAAAYASPQAAEVTGVPAEDIRALAREYALAKPGAIRIGYGVDRWYNADLTARAVAALACLCGFIGLQGGGVSLVDGGRSVPVRGSHFYAPDGKLPTFLSLMELDEAVREGTPYPIKMECISLGNPFNHVKPNRKRVLSEYVGGLEFIAVIDHFMTDTAKYADLVLPACTVFERTDIVVDEFLQLQQRVVEPVGEAKSDFEIFQLIARATGLGEYFEATEGEYIDRMLDTDSPLLDGVDFKRLQQEKVIFPWDEREPYVGLKDRSFPTGSGRIEFYKEDLLEYNAELPFFREPIEASPQNPLFQKYPLVLLSSHSRYRIHSTFANLETVKRFEGEPIARIHPADARERQIEDGSRYRSPK